MDYGVLPIGELRPPSGAYALQEALRGGHNRVEVIGFDSIAGVFSTSSQLAFKEHDSSGNKVIQDRLEKWMVFYETVTKQYEEIEVIWHTKED